MSEAEMAPLGELPLSLPPALVRKPNAFNNVWMELRYFKQLAEERLHNQGVLIRIIEEIAEGAQVLDADTAHYSRLLAQIKRGGERVDINPKSGGRIRGHDYSGVVVVAERTGAGGHSASATGRVHLGEEGSSAAAHPSGQGVSPSTDGSSEDGTT